MRARFIGDQRDDGAGPKVLRLFGLEFPHSVWVGIDGNETALRKLPNNSHFEVDSGEAETRQLDLSPPANAPRRGRPPKALISSVGPEADDDEFSDL